MLPVDKVIDSVVTENKKPKNLKENSIWATHSGVLKIGEIELRCHVLSNGMRIFDKDDIDKYFGDITMSFKD